MNHWYQWVAMFVLTVVQVRSLITLFDPWVYRDRKLELKSRLIRLVNALFAMSLSYLMYLGDFWSRKP